METNELFSKIRQHAWIGALAFSLLAIGFFFYQRQGEKNERTLQEDYKIVSAFSLELAKGKEPSQESLTQMAALLNRHPEMAPSFDNSLAIACFSIGNSDLGNQIAGRMLQRTSSLVDEPIVAFSKISLLIESGNLDQAKADAIALEEKLSSSPSLQVLRAYNLIRLAFLTKDTAFLEKVKTLSSYSEIAPLFRSGTLTLENFIQP